jgi:hypothetical protein
MQRGRFRQAGLDRFPHLGNMVLFRFFMPAQIKKQHQYQRHQVNEISDWFHFHFYRVAGRVSQGLSKSLGGLEVLAFKLRSAAVIVH